MNCERVEPASRLLDRYCQDNSRDKGVDHSADRVVDDTLRRLRKKLPDINIQTLYGFGYRLS